LRYPNCAAQIALPKERGKGLRGISLTGMRGSAPFFRSAAKEFAKQTAFGTQMRTSPRAEIYQNEIHGNDLVNGILPFQDIIQMEADGWLTAEQPITDAQVQPASLDLRLGPIAYRVRASFLPGADKTVRQRIEDFGMHEIDLSSGAVLEKGCVYIVPLMESLNLPPDLSAMANPKSSTGRLDIFTRLIVDRGLEFDRVRAGYSGPLFAEISPRTFSIFVRPGARLNQIRFRRGPASRDDADLRRLQDEVTLVSGPGEGQAGTIDINNGIALSVDLTGVEARIDRQSSSGDIPIGWRAKKHTAVIDLDRIGAYDPYDFWEPITPRGHHGARGRAGKERPQLILDPDEFYILASKEAVTVPADHAAEMVAYDTLVGEFRVHYAGFFDPGFGTTETGGRLDGGVGTRAVLEVRSHEVPFVLEDGQIIGRLVYERMTDVPTKLYGVEIGSNYQRQGLALSKQFRRD